MSTDSVVSIAWDVFKIVFVPIKHRFEYVMCSKRYADGLRKEVENLENEAERVGRGVEMATRNVKDTEKWVKKFLESAEKALKEAKDLLGEFENMSKTCCHGTLPDPICRYQFSRQAKHSTDGIKNLILDIGGKEISAGRPAPGDVAAWRVGKDVVQPTTVTASTSSASTSIKLRDDEVFGSRDMIIRDVMDALANNSNSVVGVYGMGGAGKSTLLEEVKRIISKGKSFDWVAKADVSENPDIKTIQGEIADGLGLVDIKEKETVSGRAELLHGRLEKEEMEKKKVLIILDNLWKGLDLKSVGIPCGPDNKVKGCKLLLTSRDQHLLQREMGCDKAISLGGMEKEEAKILFERIVGDKVREELFESLVDEALHKCAGLPLLIVTMAKHFKAANLSEWKDALRQIEVCTNDGLSAVINKMLQVSYDHLESQDAKSLLQLCVAYSVSEPSIENLLRYGYGLGIFRKNSSIKEARDRLTTLIRTLQASSLLLDSGGADSFKIHDLVRDFVAQFVLRDQPLLLLKDKDMRAGQLRKESCERCTAICFPYIDMKKLPEELNCPELRTFLLFTNNDSLEVLDSYFNSMKKLAVLNLTGVSLTRSPRPFEFLDNLHTLCLQRCSLEDVAILGELKGLQILSLAGSRIQQLPKEVGQLKELRLLDLNHCSELQKIEPGVLGTLIKLEELYMEDSFDQWNVVEQTPPTNASLTELNHMNNLCTLHVSIPNLSALPESLDVEKLTKYIIKIGEPWYWWSSYRGSRTLDLKSSNVVRKGCIQTILGKTDNLILKDLNGSEQSICRLSQKGLAELKHLVVVESPSVHCILQSQSHAYFEKLESLLLVKLIKLEKICHGHISSKSFGALKVVRVESCDKMKVLFPPSVVRGLPKLEEIVVVNCTLMCGIIEVDDRGKLELPKLRVLRLCNLPNIKSFSTDGASSSSGTSDDQVGTPLAFFNVQQVSIPSLESLTMEGLPNLEEIWSDESLLELSNLQYIEAEKCQSLSKVISFRLLMNLQKLCTLIVKNCVSMQEIFYHDGLSSSGKYTTLFEPTTFSLEELKVDNCDNLRFMFFPSMFKTLAQLRDLSVSRCKKMEAIIMEEEQLGLGKSETLAFPRLTNLCLEQLESLICFYCGKSSQKAQSHNLVQSCSSALFNREVSIPSLESLTIEGLPNLKEIWSNESPLELSNLQSIKVKLCQSLSKVISFRSLMNLQKLRTLTIQRCVSMQDIFYLDAPSVGGNYTTIFEGATLSLEKLEVRDCDNLRFIFKPFMVKPLAQLRHLEVSWCEKMEAIIIEEKLLGLETSEILAFPMLTKLCLEGLESLICFSPVKSSREAQSHDLVQSCSTALFNKEVVFPSLEELEISNMGSIERIMGNQVASDCFQNLKSLCLRGCNKLKCVWDKELHHQVKFQCLRKIRISRCTSLTCLFPASIARDLTQLEELEIDKCGIVELIEKEEGLIPGVVLPKLTSLKLKHLMELKCTYTGLHALHWPALKTLEVHGCNKVEIFALQPESNMSLHKQPLFLIEKGGFPNLQELKLDLSEQMEIWHGHFQNEEFYHKLRVLELRHLLNDSAISTCHFIERLTNLEELVVCQSYLEKPSNNVEAMEGPRQEQKVILPFSRRIQHLKTLDVSHCDGLSNIFTPIIVEYLGALTKLKISYCRMLTEVISDETGKEGRVVVFNQLKYLELDGLMGLRCFSSGGYTLMFPLLEDVIVTRCPNMKLFSEGSIEAPKLERVKVYWKEWFWTENLNITIKNMFGELGTIIGVRSMWLSDFPQQIRKWPGELSPVKSSWQLRSLVVDRCASFLNAIPSRLMLVLNYLNVLQVRDCESLEEIFDLEGLEAIKSTQVLHWLSELRLVNLPKLRRLWNKDLQELLRFGYLRNLFLYNCSNLGHAFTPSMAQCLANLWMIEIKECGQMEAVIVDEDGPGSTVEEIAFPNLGRIELERLPNLTSFLLGKNHSLKCPKLKKLTIAHCPKMRSLTRRSRMEIDEGIPSLFTSQVQFPRLKSMALSNIDNLSKIWIDSPQENLTFDNLEKVEAQHCKSLVNLFPYWVATSLNQIRELRVKSCGMEKIVTGGDDISHTNTSQVLFPKLTSLVLHDMPQLKSFCPNLLTLNWPLMDELRVTHCNRLCLAASMNKWAQKDDQQYLLDQEAHSSFERGFPNIERLLLVEKDIQMMEDGKFPNDIFGKPKVVTLACFHDKKAVFPPRSFLERFQNMQSIEIFCCSFEDIFPDEELVDEGKHSVLESLGQLKLSKLHNLKRVWREDSLVSKILQSIKKFEVWDCPGLTTLFPTVTSFQNMTELVVKNSSGLVNLITVSAVMNLVHLTEMTIIGCERMKEVVENDENGEGKVISFGKLERLTLQQLPSLECFSSTTSCSFKFPSLYSIVVKECPKIKIFSKGMLSTPALLYVYLFGYKWQRNWEGDADVNTIIQKLST